MPRSEGRAGKMKLALPLALPCLSPRFYLCPPTLPLPPPPRPLVPEKAAEVGVRVASSVGMSCREELPGAVFPSRV